MKHIKEFNEFINEASILRGSRASVDNILIQRKVIQYLKNNPDENEVIKKAYGTIASLYDKQAQFIWRDIQDKLNVLANTSFDDIKAARYEADSHAGITRFSTDINKLQVKLNKIVSNYQNSLILPIMILAGEGGSASDVINYTEYNLDNDSNTEPRKPELSVALTNVLNNAKEIVKNYKNRLSSIENDIDNRINSL
jgi:hypothetical protein